MSDSNEFVLQSFKQFLETYDTGKSGPNVNSPVSDRSTVDVADLSSEMQTVVLRSRTTTDSCLFSDHTISPNDVEPEVFDWIFYHLDYKKCPHPLAFALASIVSRKLGLAETTRESLNSDADKSKPVISSNELYSQSLEYLTEYINSWKENPEIAVEIAKEYSDQRFPSSICAIKNCRRKMEDRHVVLHDLNKALALKTPKQYSYYAIFDGHAGVDAASYASAHLHHNLVQSQAFLDGDITGAFKEAFSMTDLHYLERSAREGKKSGSTALCGLLEDKTKLYIAWLGDSIAILVRNGKPIDIMIPHKPDLEEERNRIEALGGFVAYVDTWRVNGTLAVSRAIGDPEYKPYISSEPDIVPLDIDPDTDFLIMGCDGLWDQLTPEEATSLVYEYICENEDQNIEEISSNVATHLSKTAKYDGSSDNITTIVIFFKDLEQLRATPFTPLTPREKNETNGLNGNHFQYNDFEFTQSNTKNPFDMSPDSAMNQMMNTAKLNFEISDSINSSESENSTNDLKGISNPFSNNDYSYADLNANKPFDSTHNESSLLKERTNSFDNNDKLESDASRTFANDCSQMQSFQSDSQFNISKLSEISSSFPTQAVIHSDNALCSTPIQTFDSNPFEPKAQQNIVLETNMDSFDGTQDSHSMIQCFEGMDSFENRTKESFNSAQSDFDETNSFDKTGYQTAYECDFEQHLQDSDKSDTPMKSPIQLGEVCEQLFTDIDERTPSFSQNQNINDFSSDAESVDSFCYEKIGSDLSKISEKITNDCHLQQIYGTLPTDSNQQMLSEENKEDINQSEAKESNTDIMYEALVAEHMTPEEAHEVTQQLSTEQNEVESTQQYGEEAEHKVTRNEQNLFELNDSLVQQKSEEQLSEGLSDDLLGDTNAQQLIVPQTMTTSDVFQTEIPSNVSIESNDELIINEFNSQSILDNQELRQLEETITPEVGEQEINTENMAQELIASQLTFDIPPVEVNSVGENVDEKLEELIVCEDNIKESIDRQMVEENYRNDLMAESLASPVEDKPIPETHIENYMNGFAETQTNFDGSQELSAKMTSNMTPEPTVEQISDSIESTVEPTQLFSNQIPNSTVEQTLDPILEPSMERTSVPTQETNTGLIPDSTSEPFLELIPSPTLEPKSDPIPEPTLEPESEPIPEPTVEPTSDPIPEPTVEPTSHSIREALDEIKFETKSYELETIESKSEALSENIASIGGTPSKPNESVANKPQTIAEVPAVVPIVKPIQPKQVTTKTTKVLKSKPIPSKTTKLLTKSDPKSKATTNTASASAANKITQKPISKVGTTSRVGASSAQTKPSSGLSAKTTGVSKPMTAKTETDSIASTTRTAARKPVTTAVTSRVSPPVGALPKSSITSKPSSRVGTSSTIPSSRSASAPTTKPAVKTVAPRAPISSRTATTTSSRTATSATRTSPVRTNGVPASSTTTAAKPSAASNLIRKPTTAPKTAPSSTVNGTKSGLPPKAATVGLKSTINKTGRTAAPTSGLTNTSSNKTTKPNTTSSISQNKTGLKPISVKGKTSAKDVPKPIATAVESNGISKTTPTMTTSMSSKNNPLKVQNSLKQELEDAMSQPNAESNPTVETPNSAPDMSTPDTLERAFLLSGSLNLESSPDVAEKN